MKKKYWFYILFAVSLVIIAVASTFLAVNREDRGYLVRDCEGEDSIIVWEKAVLPIVVRTEQMPDWGAFTQGALQFWNGQMNQPTFADLVEAELGNEAVDPIIIVKIGDEKCMDERTQARGGCHAVTKLQWNKECKIRRATITVPLDTPMESRRRVMIHEFGHVLGLDHDDFDNSVMYPKILHWSKQKVTEKDLLLLAGTYGD